MNNLTIRIFWTIIFGLIYSKLGIFIKNLFIAADMYEILLRQSGLMMVYIKPKLVT
jgi:hypothetical protein